MQKFKKKKKIIIRRESMRCQEGLLVVQFLSQLQISLVDLMVLVAPVVWLRSVCNLKRKKQTDTQKQTKKIAMREEDKH